MRISFVPAVVIVGLFFAMPGRTVGQSSKARSQACENAKTQSEMNQCSADAYRASDKDLNALYASIKQKLDPDLFAKLQTAQRAWVSYRDADCEAESAQYEGGSIQPMIRSGCLERVTRTRIDELHVIYDTGTH